MLADRRVKIVATIGPATRSKENLEKAIRAGLNVARLNFSHGTHEEHHQVIRDIRELSEKLKAPVTILQDLQGPKIRVGRFEGGSTELVSGSTVTITTDEIKGRDGIIPTDLKVLPQACRPGMRILLDDGLLELVVKEVSDSTVVCQVLFGGILKDRKGMNIPGAQLPVDCLTKKDLKDLDFGLENAVDYVALSFVRQAKDIRRLREIIESRGAQTRICAKIEMLEALDNLEEIARLSDSVMVARGDLAVEVGQTQLPGLQKRIISLCNNLGKPVITATQMLDSMVENPRPTRAEITDVANAVLDGSDACMLSAESASGKYPFKCIRTMHEIIGEVELKERKYYHISLAQEFLSVAQSIGASASLSALKLNASAIVCLTNSGFTASIISSFRPRAKIIAATDNIATLNKLEGIWGIQTLPLTAYETADQAWSQVEKMIVQYGLVKTGDRVVLTLGLPMEENAKTNTMRVYTIDADRLRLPKLGKEEIPLRCQSEDEILVF